MFHLMSCNYLCHMPRELLTLQSISPFLHPSAAFRLCNDDSTQALTGSSGRDDSTRGCLGNAGNPIGHCQKRTLPLSPVLCVERRIHAQPTMFTESFLVTFWESVGCSLVWNVLQRYSIGIGARIVHGWFKGFSVLFFLYCKSGHEYVSIQPLSTTCLLSVFSGIAFVV